MKIAGWLVAFVVVVTAVIVVTIQSQRSAAVVTAAPREQSGAEWSVSKAYTAGNKVVPGALLASAESADGRADISVRCSKGFSGVYVRPESHPQFEAGTDSATFTSSLDGSAEATGHADMTGNYMLIGQAPMVRQLAKGRRLTIRYTPFDGDHLVSMDFDLRGLPVAMAAMQDVCGPF